MKNKQREFWLDICTPYGDPCDFISKKPHEHPSATNIHVREVDPEYDAVVLELVEALKFNDQFWECCAEFSDPKYCGEYADAAEEKTNTVLAKYEAFKGTDK